jgi:protein SCO1/2
MNDKPAQKLEWLVWSGLVLVIAVICGAFLWSRLKPGPVSADKSMPVLGQLPDFTLTNQNNQPVSLAKLRGQVWVADIIFTRCPGPCAKMTRHLAELQSELPADKPVKLVTLTSDPEYDHPPVLKKYSERFGADASRWWFLTGDKPQIRRLAVEDFKFVVVEKKPEEREIPEDLFIHSTWFVLVDQKGRVRGWTDREGNLHAYYDSEDPAARKQILAGIKELLREPAS